MLDEYPKNYLAAIEYANLLNAAGRGSEAIEAARAGVVLSMLADFTALPAALWILFRARPDEE